jgi:hypothetical protein
MIFDYWKHWMPLNDETIAWVHRELPEGIIYCDGYNATFWYLLNVRWYEMNNKLYAATGSTEPYWVLSDFDEDYLIENGWK